MVMAVFDKAFDIFILRLGVTKRVYCDVSQSSTVYTIKGITCFFHAFTFTRPRVYKTFFMLNSTEHEMSNAHKNENTHK